MHFLFDLIARPSSREERAAAVTSLSSMLFFSPRIFRVLRLVELALPVSGLSHGVAASITLTTKQIVFPKILIFQMKFVVTDHCVDNIWSIFELILTHPGF